MSIANEEHQKPLDIDQLLKQMLLERPELMAELKKSVPADESSKTPSKPRERKAPGEDFYLQVISGCETCHAITILNYSMKWDSEKGCFRQRTFCLKENTPPDTEVKTQIITSRNCPSCERELNLLEKHELATLIIKSSEPEFTIVRLLKLKKKLKEFVK